jgi:hypothetical protein
MEHPVTISLHDPGKILWELTSKDQDFINGFAYGALFMLIGDDGRQIRRRYLRLTGPAVIFDDPNEKATYFNVPTLAGFYLGISDFIYETSTPLNKIKELMAPIVAESKYLPDPVDKYLVWLLDPTDNTLATLIIASGETFFQGLFTALNAANVPYDKAVLHKPIRNGIAYDIEGLELPML